MLQKMTRTNEKGFTLIELMIVIAIIGILAAIAIPNFISYRNKAFCSAAESDANSISAAIANYFANPVHTTMPTIGNLAITMSGGATPNTYTLAAADPNLNITIAVTDISARCPADYKSSNPAWNGAVYTKTVKQ